MLAMNLQYFQRGGRPSATDSRLCMDILIELPIEEAAGSWNRTEKLPDMQINRMYGKAIMEAKYVEGTSLYAPFLTGLQVAQEELNQSKVIAVGLVRRSGYKGSPVSDALAGVLSISISKLPKVVHKCREFAS